MADIGVSIGAVPEGLNRGLASAQAAVRAAAGRMQAQFEGLRSTMRSVSGSIGLLSGALAGLGVAGIARGIGSVVSEMGDLDDAAQQSGASVESLSSLLNTLRPTGVGLDQITGAMARLNKAMTDADEETKDAAQAFAALGVQTRDSAGNLRPVEAVLDDVARRLGEYRDGSNKTALAIAIFGRQGAGLIPMLNDMAKLHREASTVTGQQAGAAADLTDELGRLRTGLNQVAQVSLGPLVTAMATVVTAFNDARRAGAGLFDSLQVATIGDSRVRGEIARLQAGIEVLRSARKIEQDLRRANPGMQDDGVVAGIDAKIQQYQAAIAGLESRLAKIDPAAAMGEMNSQAPRRPGDAPPLPPRDPGAAARASAAAALAARQQQALQQMDQMLLKEQQLGQAELMRIRTTTGEYAAFSESVKTRLMMAAEELDRINALEAATKAAADAEAQDLRELEALRREAQAVLRQQNEELDRAADRWRDLIDPTRQYTRQLEEIRRLVQAGKLTPQQGLDAEFAVESARQDGIDGAIDRLRPPDTTWIGTLEGGFNQLFSAIQTGSVTTQGVLQGAFGMMASVATGALSKIGAEWVASMITSRLIAVKTALSDISASAARAGAAAFASTAAIPIVGPGLAPAAGAAGYAGAMSFASGLSLASASRGFDIPAHVNPLTQLHAREMVLPAEHADTIRQMSREGPRTAPPEVHLHAYDSRSIEDLLGRDSRRTARLAARVESMAAARRRRT